MHIEVNGTRLWFDVDGAALVPDGPAMRERPTVVLLHGGPGSFDHSYLKPEFARLSEAAQVADELGYYACYSADEIYHKDAWLLLVAAAGRSERIRLGPCVSPIYLRDPTYVAQLAATLDELSGGRAEVVLGI